MESQNEQAELLKIITAFLAQNKIPYMITGARDIFVHEYFGIKLERVWQTIIEDLPKLKKVIKTATNDNTQD